MYNHTSYISTLIFRSFFGICKSFIGHNFNFKGIVYVFKSILALRMSDCEQHCILLYTTESVAKSVHACSHIDQRNVVKTYICGF